MSNKIEIYKQAVLYASKTFSEKIGYSDNPEAVKSTYIRNLEIYHEHISIEMVNIQQELDKIHRCHMSMMDQNVLKGTVSFSLISAASFPFSRVLYSPSSSRLCRWRSYRILADCQFMWICFWWNSRGCNHNLWYLSRFTKGTGFSV